MDSTRFRCSVQGVIVRCISLIFLISYPACQTPGDEDLLLMSVDYMEFVSEGSYWITGSFASLGDQEISAYGLCWCESRAPDLEDNYVELDMPIVPSVTLYPVVTVLAQSRFPFVSETLE